MAIHPTYAEAILAGSKTVEFRKRRLAADIDRVLIYATSPVQKIIGEFSIARVDAGSPESVWDAHGDVGSIAKEDFDEYYKSAKEAIAIVISQTVRYDVDYVLSDFSPPLAIPQSFSYLDEHKGELLFA